MCLLRRGCWGGRMRIRRTCLGRNRAVVRFVSGAVGSGSGGCEW